MLERRSDAEKPKRTRVERYRDGGDGFCAWCEENVRIPVYKNNAPIPSWVLIGELSTEPVESTGRSFWDMWCNQREVLKRALVMKDGRLKHRLIVFCWPRGEGKSALACLIQLWKFFNFPRQQIMLGANSKDQVKFVHFDIMRDTVLNSPNLLRIVGKRNVQEKEIRLQNKEGVTVSLIRSISSFSGIVSNITGYTFSEMFDMKNPKFFVQLDGSTRNIPNALGVIDSTVSEKTHVLYKLYKTHQRNKDPNLFFHYRCSPEGSYKDMWHPYNSQEQLDSYREKFPQAEFDRYFKNIWEVAGSKFFKAEVVKAANYIGVYGTLGMHSEVVNILQKAEKIEASIERMDEDFGYSRIESMKSEIQKIKSPLTPLSSVYQLSTESGHARHCTFEELQKLGQLYNTDFAICIGLDRADPMKQDLTKGARTILTAVAKGLPNSKNNPEIYMEDSAVKKYIYFLVDIVHIESSTLNEIQHHIQKLHDEFDGLESFCSERWGMWDFGPWCEEKEMRFEAIQPSYDRQKAAFSELYSLHQQGLFKTPEVRIPGAKNSNLLEEEILLFDHNPAKKWYGSPEKNEKYGVQDDSVFSLAWAIYGGRELAIDDFRERSTSIIFGEMFQEKTIGDY